MKSAKLMEKSIVKNVDTNIIMTMMTTNIITMTDTNVMTHIAAVIITMKKMLMALARLCIIEENLSLRASLEIL
jgi:hypothetical protein